MYTIEDLFDEINELHSTEPFTDPSEIDALERKCDFPLPSDLKTFYRKYMTVELFDSPDGATYRFVPVSDIHPTRIDIYGKDTDEWGPSTWLTICDVLDGNYIALDIASESGDQYNYIDCFHETFAEPGESKIIAKSFTELLHSAIKGGGDKLFWGYEGFTGYGDGMPLTAQNAATRIEIPEAPKKGWLVKFTFKGRTHHEFVSDRDYGGKEESFNAIERYIEEVTK